MLGGNIALDIMVNNNTNQQIRSTTIHLQRVGIDTYIGPCVDSYNRIKTTGSVERQTTMEAIKTDHGSNQIANLTINIYSHIQCFTVVPTDPL